MSLSALRGEIAGQLLEPGDDGFEDARRVWNGMIDRRPLGVIRAASVADIAPTIRTARALGVPLAIRGGGHNVAGNGTVDGGIVLDLGALNDVEVDPSTREVRVSAGATLADVDRATEPHGLAVPIGVVSGTGVAGLTLGGGVGWLTRAYGLSVDDLLAVEMVTVDGDTIRATATEEPELFWGVRGGGGNFGVVTAFTFRAHPMGPDIFAGTFIFAPDRWADALRGWEAWTRAGVPDPLTSIATFMTPPPDFELGDDPVMLLGWVWASPERTEGERVVGALRGATHPDAEAIQPTTWTGWQSAADSLFPKGVRAYWKNTAFERLDDATIDVIVRRAAEQTWRGTAFDIHHMEGAYGRVPEDATPFPDRAARYWLNIYGYWPEATDDAERIAFVRSFATEMEPHGSTGRYVNFLGQEGDLDGAQTAATAAAVYGRAKLARLVALKRRFDPENVLRLNHNIPPG